MKLKYFNGLCKRDFDNAAVLHEIRQVFKERDELLEACEKVVNNWGNLHPKDRQQLKQAIAREKGEGK